MPERLINILAVEDNPADRALLARFFKECSFKHRLTFARDGEEATDILFRRGNWGQAPRPDLVLLDLNMPKKDGRDVLREIKADPSLRKVPVVVLTTSSNEVDVNGAYDFHANSYIQKPREFEGFQAVISMITQYWLSTVELPQ